MPDPEIPWEHLELAKGEDWQRVIFIKTGESVDLTADAATSATSLSIKSNHPAFASGDKMLVGKYVVLTLSGACAAGATTMSVTAIAGPLKRGDKLEKLVKDLSGYTLTDSFEVLANAGDATPVLTITPTVGEFSDDPNAPKVDTLEIVGAAADMDFGPGNYVGFIRRLNSSTTRTIFRCRFDVVEEGFNV